MPRSGTNVHNISRVEGNSVHRPNSNTANTAVNKMEQQFQPSLALLVRKLSKQEEIATSSGKDISNMWTMCHGRTSRLALVLICTCLLTT